jgi:hypothetical protein
VKSRTALAAFLIAATVSGCTSPVTGNPVAQRGKDRPAIPAVLPAEATNCPLVDAPGGACTEWRRLDPQPSFADFIRLADSGTPAPDGLEWGALYLCGALPQALLDEHLGPGSRAIVVNDFICAVHSADAEQTRAVDVYLGNDGLDHMAEVFPEGERSQVDGRDVLYLDSSPESPPAVYEWYVAIPQSPDHVLHVETIVWSTFDDDFNETIDQEGAKRFADDFLAEVIALSEP